MKFTYTHCNINVTDIDRSVKFFQDALGLEICRVQEAADGSFKLVFLTDGVTGTRLELTWLRDHPQAYELGDNESHIGFQVDDYEAAHAKHEAMGCICFENHDMGIYFIEDPDGYWHEVTPFRG